MGREDAGFKVAIDAPGADPYGDGVRCGWMAFILDSQRSKGPAWVWLMPWAQICPWGSAELFKGSLNRQELARSAARRISLCQAESMEADAFSQAWMFEHDDNWGTCAAGARGEGFIWAGWGVEDGQRPLERTVAAMEFVDAHLRKSMPWIGRPHATLSRLAKAGSMDAKAALVEPMIAAERARLEKMMIESAVGHGPLAASKGGPRV